MKTTTWWLALALCGLMATMLLSTTAQAGSKQTITMTALDGSSATGTVVVTTENGHTTLTLTVAGLSPNTVHSLWHLFDATASPFIIDPVLGLAVVTDDNLGTLAPVFPVGPATADNAGFKAGTGLDPNGFLTNSQGKAKVTIKLNYDITRTQIAPVVLAPLSQTVQVEPATELGTCTASAGSKFQSLIDSGFARKYDTSGAEPSFQLKESKARARLIRATVADLIVVEHLDGLTHGHAPGIMAEVSGCGDHMGKLIGPLTH